MKDMHRTTLVLVALLSLLLTGAAGAKGEGPVVKDLNGETVQPLEAGQEPAVYVFVLADCPISNAYSPELERIRKEFSKRGVRFYLVYTDPDRSRDDILKHQKDYSLEAFPAIHDRKHEVVKALGAQMTPESALVDSKGRRVYLGRIDDLYADFGKRRAKVGRHDLRDAIDAVVSGKAVKPPGGPAFGCYIPPVD